MAEAAIAETQLCDWHAADPEDEEDGVDDEDEDDDDDEEEEKYARWNCKWYT